MKKIIIPFIAIAVISSCKKSEKEVLKTNNTVEIEKIYFNEIEDKLSDLNKLSLNGGIKYKEYQDSLISLITGTYLDSHNFITLDGENYDTNNNEKAIFLQATASWCKPCAFEVPEINELAEKYKNDIDFLLLFWDDKDSLQKLKSDYNKYVILVPAEERLGPNTINADGFNHIFGFPFNYIIKQNRKIVDVFSGGYLPGTFTNEKGEEITRTEEEARNLNYERLESAINLAIE